MVRYVVLACLRPEWDGDCRASIALRLSMARSRLPLTARRAFGGSGVTAGIEGGGGGRRHLGVIWGKSNRREGGITVKHGGQVL